MAAAGQILPTGLKFRADGGKILPALPMNSRHLFSRTHVVSLLTPVPLLVERRERRFSHGWNTDLRASLHRKWQFLSVFNPRLKIF